ncbi:MAG TPA: metal-dependent transcriptional regulator [Vicinamibacterales bacterium]
MLPSSTVENYLKKIYLGSTGAPGAEPRLLPMGQLAAALGVTPGTATTMVKTLAESGLVNYEPYAGVSLTRAGRRLAALVLRRHRLVELFLVRVMGLRWDEVHDEAELLEHVVSDRLIDRMDEMLGRPEVDPHGDPIPDAEGVVKKQPAQTLLSCPVGTRMTVTRIIDQDKQFLRFVENHNLKPGESVEVEERDEVSDSVRLRGKGDRLITIGARAASKLLVQVARVVLLVLGLATAARAQQADPEAGFPSTGPISGYMDFHVNKADGEASVIDFHRFVLLVSHSFTSKIRFVGELEVEHAFVEGLEESGELELEQAYIDFLLSRPFNIRAGMLLLPMGIINERHEPPVFNGVERPFVDTVIIPTTWFDAGAGVHGEIGRGLRYRAYVTAPLDAREFSADEGIREGRQKGGQATAARAAFTGRAEYLGIRGLTAGAALWRGTSRVTRTPELKSSVTVGEADARYRRGRLELRGEIARVDVGNAAALNDSLGRALGVPPNIASALRGFYGEAGYRIWDAGAPRDLVTFFRYENFDTQFRMPAGLLPLKEFDRDAFVVGTTYYPDPDVAVKADYIYLRNRSGIFANRHQLNVGLGWWF